MNPCLVKDCGKPANNFARNLCDEHAAEVRETRRLSDAKRLATERAKWRYFIPDGDLGVLHEDEGRWRSYDIVDAYGNTPEEFLENLSVSEVDQDGGEIDTYGYSDAPGKVQWAIDQAGGLHREAPDKEHDGTQKRTR